METTATTMTTTVRGPNATESRPARDTSHKKMATFLQRISPHRRTANVTSTHTVTSVNASVPINNDTSPLKRIARPPKIAPPSFRSHLLAKGNSHNIRDAIVHNHSIAQSDPSAVSIENLNAVQWLQLACPPDIVPKILAYTGPKLISTIACVNRHWRNVLNEEATWRALCEELYKWKHGDEMPDSWKEYYMNNPCVPIDCRTIHSAIAQAGMLCNGNQPTRSLRVFIRPGRYVLKESVLVHAASPNVNIRLETMELPDTVQASDDRDSIIIHETPPQVRTRKRTSKLRRMLSCRSADNVVDGSTHDDASEAEFPEPVLPVSNIANDAETTPKRAVLMLRTRRDNEPLVRVRQGTCMVKNIDLYHISRGLDIWNGNAAVQIQPPIGPDDQPLAAVRPRAILEQVDVTSLSGRGIVNIDGGDVTIRNCYVHDCAATGIYVGGPGSRASISKTDVVKNGFGNRYHRGGIARGHSGIYLEQGHAKIADCNISRNSLTGISAVSPENAILDLSDSDLMSNGSFQLEMPALGTVARRASLTENNTMAAFGMARARSGLVVDEE